MKLLASATLALACLTSAAQAQVNAGSQTPEATLPFTLTQVATFNLPWRIAFLPDGRMLITEKVGPLWLVTHVDLHRTTKVQAFLRFLKDRAKGWSCD